MFGKSFCSIIRHILEHPSETFDVKPFIHGCCKHPIDKIQTAVDGAISREQATKLRICLDFIYEQQKCISELDTEILRLEEPYSAQLNLIRTVRRLSKEPLKAICILTEIGVDMSVFPISKYLVSWADCCLHNDLSTQKVKSIRISRAGVYLKSILVQIAKALLRSKSDLEFQ